MRIYQANKDRLPDVTTVIVGQKLVIPSLSESITAPHGRGVSAVKDVVARGATDGASRRRISANFQELTIKQLHRRLGRSERAAKKKPLAKASRAVEIYKVRSGDTLSEIALKYLGSQKSSAVRRIFEANRDKLSSPDEVYVGMKLRIPS